MSNTNKLIGLIIAATLSRAPFTHAELTYSTDQGFVSEHSFILKGSTDQVYQALTTDIHRWWNAEHSYSGKADNFSLEAKAGGCFCEKLENGGSVEHLRVVFANPNTGLRLLGGLGPLQEMAVQGSMDFKLTAQGIGQTTLDYRYAVSGDVPGGLKGIATAVDRVQLGQLQRLQTYLLTGSPSSD